MKMTNKEMELTLNSLNMIITSDLELPSMVTLAMARNFRKLKEEAKEYLEKRQELITKYGKKLDDGRVGIEATDKEAISKFDAEIGPLDSMEFDIDIYKIPISEFRGRMDDKGILFALEFMIEY